MKLPHTLPSFVLAAAFAAANLAAQAPPPPAAPPAGSPPPAAAAPAPAADPETLAALASAQERFQAGDLAGAIAALEPLRGRPNASAPALSLLGALYVEVGRFDDALALLGPLAEPADANAAVLYNASRAAGAAGRAEAGRRYLERAAALLPVSPAGRDLGLLLAQEGRDEEAYALLRPWAVRRQEDQESRMAAALLALRLRRAGEAEELIAGLPEDDPKARLLRGQLLLAKADPRAAVAVLEPLKDQHPPEIASDLRRILADAYIRAGQGADAVVLLEKGDLGDPATVLLMAEAQYQSGEAERALALLKPIAEAIRDQQTPPESEGRKELGGAIARAYGRFLVAAGRQAEAVPVLEKAVQLLPQDSQAWQSYGQALMGVGRRDDAVAAFNRFSALTQAARTTPSFTTTAASPVPTNPKLREAMRLLEGGHREKALEIARAEMAASSDDLWPRVLVVRILLVMGKPDDALPVAQEALRLAPDHPDAVYQRGAVQMAMQRKDEAERDFRRALQLAPAHVPAMNDLAVLLMLRNADAEARGLLEKVLELRPDDVMASRNLQKLKEKTAGG